jgi:O-antigen/teichoic acid export membrane protein
VQPNAVLLGQLADRAHHRREAALHVVCAAPVQAVALDPRHELLGPAGDDVDVSVEDHGGALGRADGRRQHRHAVVDPVLDVDLARLEPTLHESGSRVDALRSGGVVGDQPLGEGPFLHAGEDRPTATLPTSMASEANGTGASRRERALDLARSDTGRAAGIAVAQLGANVVALVFVVAFARILGDDGYGSLGSLLSLFLILYVPGQALQVAVAREVSARVARKDPDPGAGVRRWMERLVVVTVVVAVVSVLARDGLAAIIAVEDYPWAAASAPVGACVWMILAVERGAMQAFGRYNTVGLSLVAQETVRLIGALVLVAVGLDVTGAFLGSMVGFGFVAIWLALPLHRELERLQRPAPGPHVEHGLRQLFARSWAPLLALAFIAVLQNVDVIIAKHRFSEELASAWTAAAVAGKGIMWVSIGLGFWLVPEAAKRVHSATDPRQPLERAMIGVGLIAVPMMIVYAVAAETLLDIVFKLTDASGALAWLGLAFTFLAFSYLAIQYLLALHHWTFLWPLGVAAIVQPILLSVVDGGPTALAQTLCAVQGVLALFVITMALRTRELPPGEQLDDDVLGAEPGTEEAQRVLA